MIEDVTRTRVAVAAATVRMLELEPGAQAELAGDGETMAYVVEGRGETALGPLEPESVVWLDPGDAVAVEAGPDGLRLLVAHAR